MLHSTNYNMHEYNTVNILCLFSHYNDNISVIKLVISKYLPFLKVTICLSLESGSTNRFFYQISAPVMFSSILYLK